MDKEQIIERLRQEKKQFDNEFFELGEKDGLSDARNLSYSELVAAAARRRAMKLYYGAANGTQPSR